MSSPYEERLEEAREAVLAAAREVVTVEGTHAEQFVSSADDLIEPIRKLRLAIDELDRVAARRS